MIFKPFSFGCFKFVFFKQSKFQDSRKGRRVAWCSWRRDAAVGEGPRWSATGGNCSQGHDVHFGQGATLHLCPHLRNVTTPERPLVRSSFPSCFLQGCHQNSRALSLASVSPCVTRLFSEPGGMTSLSARLKVYMQSAVLSLLYKVPQIW